MISPDSFEGTYPVPNRSDDRNRRIAAHEAGHALVAKCLGNIVHSVSIIRGPNFEGRTVRSGAISALTFDIDPSQTQMIADTCERLAALEPEMGSVRATDGECIVRGQGMVIELMAGSACEQLLFGETLGAIHDETEASAIARVCAACEPATKALLDYCRAEAYALLDSNRHIIEALMAALIEHGELSGDQVDLIIDHAITLQSIETERQRRADMQRRALNAANFLETIIGS